MDFCHAPEIRAEVESQPETRTTLSVDESGAGTIYWNPDDKIDVFFGTKRARYTSQNSKDEASAVFKTGADLTSTDASSTNIWGLYPSYGSSSCNGSSIRTMLPSQQYGVPDSFDDDLFIAAAHSTTTTLQFYNVCGGIKFNLARGDIKSVSFRGNNNENLAGEISISFSNGLPKVTVVNGVKEITLTPKNGQTFAKDENYYIVTLPVTLSKGFTVTFTKTNGTVGSLSYSDKSVTLKRAIFSKKNLIDAYATFSDNSQPNNVIYYTSSDGTVITPYKTAVFGANILSNEYVGGRGVITFDGEVRSIGPSAFYNCYGLTSMTIPNSVTSIGNRAFYGCYGLTSMTIPASVTSIGYFAFWGCSGLMSITIPESVTFIDSGAFENCSGLTSVVIPVSVSSMGYNPFTGCRKLTSVVVSSENPWFDSRNGCNAIINTASNKLVSGCQNTIIPDTVTSIGPNAFWCCSNLTSITLPNSITSIGYSAFSGCYALTSITVLASIPPSIDQYVFSSTNNCPIYVFKEKVDSYKSAWSAYADRIQPIYTPEAVDLGLSVKWAPYNVGATKPEEYGDYFAWGETQPKSDYSWATYKWCNGSENTLTKYNYLSSYGTVDNKTVLDMLDDAAHANWGGSWRMPTVDEITEFMNECTWTLTTRGGTSGYSVKGPNGNSIFLPTAGYRYGTNLYYTGSYAGFWNTQLDPDVPYRGWVMCYNSGNWYRDGRQYGQSIRTVTD